MDSHLHNNNLVKNDFVSALKIGLSYTQYKLKMAADLLENSDHQTKEYIKLNLARMFRVESTYQVSEIIANKLKKLENKISWLVLSEHWCGDAAQNLPVLQKIAEASKGKIELSIIYRDQNLKLMDAFLTNGGRSIPKLIQLSNDLQEIGTWGPRPVIAQELVKVLKSNPLTAANYASDLHLWYAKNKQSAIESELLSLINQAIEQNAEMIS